MYICNTQIEFIMKHTQALVAIFIVGSIVAVTISSIMNRATTPSKSVDDKYLQDHTLAAIYVPVEEVEAVDYKECYDEYNDYYAEYDDYEECAVVEAVAYEECYDEYDDYEECAVVEEEFYYPEDDYWQSLTADISNNQIWYASNDGEIIEPNPDAFDF